MCQGDQLVSTQGSGASLREDAESLGREDCFVNHTEVMIIVVIFNTFPTKEAEGAGPCGVWGAGSAVLFKWQSACVHPSCQCQG